jgi:hypothetical protein
VFGSKIVFKKKLFFEVVFKVVFKKN